jgi:hypothetical protein
MESIATQIEREVLSWPNVTAHPHHFGGSGASIPMSSFHAVT